MDLTKCLTRAPFPTGVYEYPRPGDRVQLEFVRFADEMEGLVVERVWARVTRVTGSRCEGEVESDPVISPVRRGSIVEFESQHVQAIARAERTVETLGAA
ncbi:MAG: hypothetical protein L0216_09185 [Planctomycetales bacterium]|nr:hypothetical protein [Planctomycetales bacterium]